MKEQSNTPHTTVFATLIIAAFAFLDRPPAHAQAPMEGAASAPDLVTQAKAAYELGMTAYELGHFDRAIDSFTKAYELDPAPVLLYNIAQAHWKRGNPEQAVVFYRRYLEADPNAQNRARIKTRIRELEAEMKEKPRPMPIEPPALTPPRPPDSGGGTANSPAAARAPAPDQPAGRVSAPAEVRPKDAAVAAATPAPARPAPPPAGSSPYWQPPGNAGSAGIPAAGKPAPNTSEIMPPVMPTDVVSEQDQRPPLYRRPWFWAGVGGATLLAVAAVFLLNADQRSWNCPDCVSTRVVP